MDILREDILRQMQGARQERAASVVAAQPVDFAAGREGAWCPFGQPGGNGNGPLRVMLAPDTEDRVRAICARLGLPVGSWLRYIVEVAVYGRDVVEDRYSAPYRAIAE